MDLLVRHRVEAARMPYSRGLRRRWRRKRWRRHVVFFSRVHSRLVTRRRARTESTGPRPLRPTAPSHWPCHGLPTHCHLNVRHGCDVSACLLASSHAQWCLLPRRHPLQCHPRGYTENWAPRGSPYVRACRSRPPLVQRASVIVIMRGFGSRKRITSTRLSVTWRWPVALPVAWLCLWCNCHSRHTLPLQCHCAQSWHAPMMIRPRRPAN